MKVQGVTQYSTAFVTKNHLKGSFALLKMLPYLPSHRTNLEQAGNPLKTTGTNTSISSVHFVVFYRCPRMRTKFIFRKWVRERTEVSVLAPKFEKGAWHFNKVFFQGYPDISAISWWIYVIQTAYKYWYKNPTLHPMAFEPYLLVRSVDMIFASECGEFWSLSSNK